MQKSTCYRLMKNKTTGASEYVITDTWLEIFKDSSGKEFRVHFHKVKTGEGELWSATEESTGLRCVRREYQLRREAYADIVEFLPHFNAIMSRYTHYHEKLRYWKEVNNIK